MPRSARTRVLAALFAGLMLCGAIPFRAAAETNSQDAAMALLHGQTCAQRMGEAVAQVTPEPSAPPATDEPEPTPSVGPTAASTPSLPGQVPGLRTNAQLYATPRPKPGSTTFTPPPIPTATPNPQSSNEPVFLQRGGATAPPVAPAGKATPTPSPEPTNVPTLAPGYIAVIADTVEGGTKKGQPADALGNVHIYYGQEEIAGEKAHFDGIRTVTITGHPYLVDHAHDSVLTAKKIVFDTIAQTARLVGGKGVSDRGVQLGLIHFSAKDLHTDPDGSAHGLDPSVTTCENPRGGYHITGKTIDVIPGDKIVINKAILWLGAAAVFYLPQLVIPLRTVQDQRVKPHWFPEVGYDAYEGFWVKVRVPFGKDQYYYGYYMINYFTKEGLGLGYVGFYASHRGKRTVSVNFYGINDQLTQSREYNVAVQEQENFSQRLRGNFNFGYQSNYGPLISIPPNKTISGQIQHQTQDASQNYSFNYSGVGSQSNSESFAFTDTRQFNKNFNQATSFTMSNSSSNYGSVSSTNHIATFDYLAHYTTPGADYQMEYNKTYTQQPYGIDKVPEFQVRPYDVFQHFIFPISAQLTAGEYSEPSNAFATWRADGGIVLGPALAKVFGSDFQASVNVDQYAYGTGDLKAAIAQTASLTTPIGSHIVNSLSYNESNFNGPGLVPFQYLDQQPTQNTKNAQDLLRFFNDDIYTLSLGFSTNFNGMAQPVSYQLAARPSSRSVVLISGSFIPGPGQGFPTTNVQLSTPFGRDASLQLVTDVNWQGGGERFADKILYYTRTIGNCYQIQVLYSEASKLISVGLNLLAFPTQGAQFAIGQSGPVIPSTFNF